MRKKLLVGVSIIIAFSALLLAVGDQMVSLALANPVTPPYIQVYSPQTNKIYSSNEILLNFTVVPNTYVNLTSFFYSLDGQASQMTNGSTILSGLSAGSHVLRIYGKGTYLNGDPHGYSSILSTIYFSTIFSTSMVIFTAIIMAAFSLIFLALLINRRRLMKALNNKKTARFWIGLICFLVFTLLFFTPAFWQIASDYLFRHDPYTTLSYIFPYISLILSLVFMFIGLYLMRAGIKSELTSETRGEQKENTLTCFRGKLVLKYRTKYAERT